MNRSRFRHLVRYSLMLLTFALLASEAVGQPVATLHPVRAAVSALLLALLANFTVYFDRQEGHLVHTITIALGLALEPREAGLIVFLGLVVGNLVRSFWRRGPSFRSIGLADRLSFIGFELAYQGLSLFAARAAYQALQGPRIIAPGAGQIPLIGFLGAFLFVHVVLFMLGLFIQGDSPREFLRKSLVPYAALELLPMPLGVLGAIILSNLEPTTFTIVAGLTGAIAIIIHNQSKVRANLEQRVRELYSLDRVSRVMRTSLELEPLLETIYLQVAHVLGVRSLYVALHDPAADTITYPLAIREGVRQDWPSRRRANRLTDWVINTGSPLLIPYDVTATLRRMGLQEGNTSPEAWLGIPLLGVDGALGCLAVFTTQPGDTFDQEDLALLTTLGAQASVAVENAQLYGQTQRRAAELATLNEISALMSATLDPDRILELVCSSAIRVVGGQKSAIFLRDSERNELWLARSEGMGHEYMQASLTLSLEDAERAAAVLTGTSQLVSDVAGLPEASRMGQLARLEGFRGFAELPLQTQGSTIGFLAVYFAEPHNFQPGEEELLKTFASQAALAVANARLYASTDQALARRVAQLSALEAIARELTATLDLSRLFDTILDRAMGFTSAELGSLMLYDQADDAMHLVASRGQVRANPDQDPSTPAGSGQALADSSGTASRAIREGATVYARDVTLEPGYQDPSGGRTRSQLSVPITREGRSLGVITLESPKMAAFGLDDQNFVAQLAAHAAIAMENAHLYEEVHERLREQSILYEAGARIASTLEAQTVLNTVALGLAQVLSAEAITVFDWDESTGVVASVASYRNGQLSPGEGGLEFALADSPLVSGVFRERKLAAFFADNMAAGSQALQTLKDRGVAALLAFPMIASDRAVGMIVVYTSRVRASEDNEIRLAQTLANQAAIAVENARLFQRVSEGRDRLAAVLNSTREGVLMIDAEGRIALANPRIELFFDLPRSRLEGQLLSDLLTSSDIPIAAWLGYAPDELTDLVQSAREGHPPPLQKADFQIEHPRPRFLQRTGAPVQDESGRVIGWVMVLRDITEEKELEEAREDLTNMIVHDLRSPLTAVLGALTLIGDFMEKEVRSGVAQQAMDVSMRSCRKLLSLVDSLLDISRLESGEFFLNRRPAGLHQIVEEAVADLTPLANEQGVFLLNGLVPEGVEVRVDSEKIGRVFTNLLDNALKFSPPGGQVRVECHMNGGDTVICEVLDSGPGIPEDYRTRVFDRFAQVPGRIGRRRGSGLGLAFVKLAVEAHSGQVWVENRPEGGSKFAFTLPLPGSTLDLALENRRHKKRD